MEQEYTLDYLIAIFRQHSELFESNTQKQMEEMKAVNPDVEWKASFNLAKALSKMAEEIEKIKTALSLKN